MNSCFAQDSFLWDGVNGAESSYHFLESELTYLGMDAQDVAEAVVSLDQANGQCFNASDLDDLMGCAVQHFTSPIDSMFYNTSRVESLGHFYQPTCNKQEIITRMYSTPQHYPSCQLEATRQRAATGSLSSVTSTVDSMRGSPQTTCAPSQDFEYELLMEQLTQKAPEYCPPFQKFADPLPVAAVCPENAAAYPGTRASITSISTTTHADIDNSSQEDETDRLIRLSLDAERRHNQQLEATAAAPAEAAPTATLNYPTTSRVMVDQPVEEKYKQCGNIKEEAMADSNPLPVVKEETTETVVSEGKGVRNGYMLRHREEGNSKKWQVDEQGSDEESNSGESEATSDNDDDCASDNSEQYQPKLERNGHRGHSYGSSGSRLSHAAHSPQLWEFLLMVLDDTSKKSVMGWKDKTDGVFKIYNSASAARLWGRHKNKGNMNYDKMSRAMRYYYSKGIFEKVPGRLVYKFSPQARQKYAHNKASFLYNRSVPPSTT